MKFNLKRIASVGLCLALGVQLSTVGSAAAPAAGYENGTALNISQIGRYASGQFNVDGGVMEIVSYNSWNGCAYAINGQSGLLTAIPLSGMTVGGRVDQLTGTDIDVKALVEAEDSSFHYGDMTSVAISPDNTTLAIALQAEEYDQPGRVAVFTCHEDGTISLKGLVETGIQPDMAIFADANTVLTADEGEPRMGYGAKVVDPKGSVTVIDAVSMTGTVVGFDTFDSQRESLTNGQVILQKDTKPSADLEPEYVAVSGGKAFITLQEANAIAVLDIASKTYDGIYSVGFEEYGTTPVDIDKKDHAYAPKTYENLLGVRMPDGISAFSADDRTYLITANEGDAREWGDEELGTAYLNEDARDFGEAGMTSPTGAITSENSGLKGKVVFFNSADYDGLAADKDYLYGGRSFTIYEVTEDGLAELFTSGDDFESLTAQYLPEYFNVSNDNAAIDDRSGKKGPEPENVTVGQVGGKTYAFVALERTGGIMVYDVTDPTSASFVNYINTRDFASIVPGSEEYDGEELDKWVTHGEVAPEGLAFIPAGDSVTGEALLLAACEVSGTMAVYQVGGEPLSAHPFSDVAEDAAHNDAVAYAHENGLMSGVSTDAFAPDRSAGRAELVYGLWKIAGEPVVNYAMDFRDVDESAEYAESIRWAASEGIAVGYGNGLFGADDSVTREQLSTMIFRYTQKNGGSTAQVGQQSQDYSDVDQVAPYAQEAMAWAVNENILPASGTDMLNPLGTVTRAQTAAILMQISQHMK